MTATATPAVGRTTERAGGGALAGTGVLLRFDLRRDRVRVPVWLAALTLGTLWVAAAFPQLYPTAAERQAAAATMNSPAGLAFTGPAHYLSDYYYGSMLSHQMLGFMVIMVGIMSVLMVARHTRTEEETGRAELVRAAVVGRHAQLAAALILTVAVNIALALLLTLSLGSLGIGGVTWAGSLLYGAAHAAAGITFAGVAAVTVQITEHSRGASGMGLAVVGAAYLVRAAGDSAGSGLSWASPIGWAQQTFAYLDNHWWPLLLNLAAAAALAALGFALSTRRDLGAGLRAARRGRPEASRALTTPLGFALRLHRGMLIGFAVGMLVLGMSYGPFLADVETKLQSVEVLKEALAQLGGATFVDSFIAMIMTLLAVVAAIYVVIATLRPRSEESSGRAEPVLATGLSRAGWLGSHLAVALVGGPVMILLAGLALAATGAPTVDESGLFWEIIAAAAAYIPALWVTAGLAVALVGWFPRASALAWLVVVYAGVVGYFGTILRFPGWMSNLSPFGHIPRIPVEGFSWTPLLVLTAIAAGLIALGLYGFRRRDLETK
ncbi:ABC transporter permease [Sphaerimonospora thailandensis]|uniref:Exporter of polyketide antibiotics n=1 Tax=Sphaerimonospora thailandensis TaxID=795644 RepID=A0A8J3RGB2_9ACTN|nr:ABC transporter permease [Sphaerimonospora thailandensis]GIH73194.1 exporter of polyketide antibiotics [Sphaerimonospora thailandensis]